MPYTEETKDAIERAFPFCSIETDNEGQIVIYTGLYVSQDTFEKVGA